MELRQYIPMDKLSQCITILIRVTHDDIVTVAGHNCNIFGDNTDLGVFYVEVADYLAHVGMLAGR